MTARSAGSKLLDVGRALFAEKGYEPTSIEEIAERAKISSRSLRALRRQARSVRGDRRPRSPRALGRITAALDASTLA